MTGMGHEDAFPRPRLSARCVRLPSTDTANQMKGPPGISTGTHPLRFVRKSAGPGSQVRSGLSAGGRRIRTLSPTLMTRNSDRLIEFDGAGSPIGRSPFRPILVER
jgi:hypothetical protein